MKRLLIGLTTMVVLAALVLAGLPKARHGTLRAMGRFLDVGEQPRICDAVWLLNGNAHSRPLQAARLVREGWADRILFTDVATFDRGHEFRMPEFERATAMIEYAGVSRDHVEVIPWSSKSTADEAAAAAAWLEEHPDATLAVVTSDFHTRRSRWVFRRYLSDEQFFMVSAPTDEFNARNWWRNRDGFALYLGENAKFVLYNVQYRPWVTGMVIVSMLAFAAWCRRRLRSGRGVSTLSGDELPVPMRPDPEPSDS